jgi:3-deoxy-D-manno-octulosonate 8-phosphate phosphatase (KDO 8-P phosphatase)
MVIFDIDGVLSDGRIIFGSDGTEYKAFDAHDGYGITRGKELGLHFAAISGRTSKVTTMRMERLGIKEVHQNQMDKVKSFRRILKKHKLTAGEVCFIGDDEFDLPLLRIVALSAAPLDAMKRVKAEVDYVTRQEGGRGAVREVVDLILAAKGLI